MKKLLFLMFLTTFINLASGQNMVQENKLWNVVNCLNFGDCATESYKLLGDTTIGVFTYKKLYYTLDTTLTNFSMIGAMRDDLNKVFYHNFENEFMLYDFSLAVNDTFQTTQYWGNPVEMVVLTIDTVDNANGDHRPRWTFNSGEQWIEGVGSLYGPINVDIYQVVIDLYYDESCCFEDDVLTYLNPNVSGCIVNTVGIDLIDSQQIVSVYPNPFSLSALIKLNYSGSHTYEFQLLNITGQKVRSINHIKSGSVVLARENLPSGLYFYRLFEANAPVATGKIIIK
ncbi:MAG: T9SS type A sorting domain-containing protein [Bacteroidales bacterium]|nr:T9SS type A sorting domain-containing protein [Bacteroidales bacterium]